MRLQFDDAELDVRDEGAGFPVVLLHGFPLAKETWDAQSAALREHARVVRLDLRGLGASRGGPGPYLMETLAGDVAGVLDALDIERAAIVGHSLGVYVAYAFYRMFAERVSALGLVCGRADGDAPEVAARRYALADLAEEGGMAKVADDYVPRFFAPETYGSAPLLVDRVRSMVLATDPRGAAAVLRGMAVRADARDLLPDIAVPVAVVAGREDAFVPPGAQEATAAAIAGARLWVLESGHLPHYEQPDALSRVLLDLLGVAARGAS